MKIYYSHEENINQIISNLKKIIIQDTKKETFVKEVNRKINNNKNKKNANI